MISGNWFPQLWRTVEPRFPGLEPKEKVQPVGRVSTFSGEDNLCPTETSMLREFHSTLLRVISFIQSLPMSMLTSSKKHLHRNTRKMSDQISWHHDPSKLTDQIGHHTELRLDFSSPSPPWAHADEQSQMAQ